MAEQSSPHKSIFSWAQLRREPLDWAANVVARIERPNDIPVSPTCDVPSRDVHNLSLQCPMPPDTVVAAIAKARRGIAQYPDMMEQLPAVNVAEDKAFHRRSDSAIHPTALSDVDLRVSCLIGTQECLGNPAGAHIR